MKYTSKQIVETVGKMLSISKEMNKNGVNWSSDSEEEYDKLSAIIDEQKTHLSECTYKDYDIAAFNELIKTIEHNGLTNFNMNTFFSKIDHENYSAYYEYVHEIPRSAMVNNISGESQLFDKTTNKFNCSTIGCVAGFATAVAMNWETPKWLDGDARDYNSYFEIIACTYLNIPVWVGRNIFYGDQASAWAFAKLYSHKLGHAYDHIKLTSEYEHIDEYEFEEYWDSVEIDLNSISYKDAVNLLSDIAEGRIIFGTEIPSGMMLNPNLMGANKTYGAASGEVE